MMLISQASPVPNCSLPVCVKWDEQWVVAMKAFRCKLDQSPKNAMAGERK